MRRFRLPFILLAVAAAVGFGIWSLGQAKQPTDKYRVESISKGDIVAAISATGTLEPEDVIDVGAQVAGMIKEFGTDADKKPVDYGSSVEAGTVLARIDDALYRAKVEQSKAAVRSSESQKKQAVAKLEQARTGVEQAKANTQRSEADVKQSAAKLDQAGKDWKRTQTIGLGGLSSQEYDASKAAFDVADAVLGVSTAALAQTKAAEANAVAAVADAEAAVVTADAAIATAKAMLQQDEVNLDYCTIKSEVKGTIIDRRVTLGQTVQSSFSTPSLFLIAKDLTRMKVWASVNEADIGQIRLGMTARFTVDAYPGRTFQGTVSRIRLNATNTQNVVVYTVEVTTENADHKLLPYMTANLQFEVDRRHDVTVVPNAALRFKPAAADRAAAAPREKGGTVVWTKADGKLTPVPVELGLTDGNKTEIVRGDLAPGTEVVVGEATTNRGGDATSNPFAPPARGGKKQ